MSMVHDLEMITEPTFLVKSRLSREVNKESNEQTHLRYTFDKETLKSTLKMDL